MVKISINLPQYAPGTEIALAGLGRFPNGGEEVELDQSVVDAFEQEQGMSIQDALKSSPGIKVDGQEGETVEQPVEETPEGEPVPPTDTTTTTPEVPEVPPVTDEGSEV